MAESKIKNKMNNIVTLYTSNNTFSNDVGVQKTLLDNSKNYNTIGILLYDTSIAAGNRLFVTTMSIQANIYLPCGNNDTYDILRFEISDDKITLLSHKNATQIHLSAVYGIHV